MRRPPVFRSAIPFAAVLALLAPPARADAGFASPAQAIAYLQTALPEATAANPTYLTRATGVTSRWKTETVSFDNADGVAVVMRESYIQTKDGKATPGRHEARFKLADVDITEFTEAGDTTPSGAPAEA